jgi:hypothetical protein
MKLRTRIERLEQRKGVGKLPKLTIAFFDSVVDGTISDEELARYVPALREILPDLYQELATDICE